MLTAGEKDHFGKFPMNTKVIVTVYGQKKIGRVCYTSERVAKILDDGCTMVEFRNRVGDWQEIPNYDIELLIG